MDIKLQLALVALLSLIAERKGQQIEFTRQKIDYYKQRAKSMFYHAYNGYLDHAYPYDELKPITCQGMDTWGSFSLTLVDALDTLIIMGNYSEFERAAGLVLNSIDFDANVNVSVFETNIRVVGGLISAHMLSGKAGVQLEDGWPCSGPLLRLAERMAQKLLPAFNTQSGMPFGTVNLRYGVHIYETPITCTAGVGTYILEFGALSRLTGNPHYERVAMKALRELWRCRSSIDLVGNHINVQTSMWTASDAGIGAGVDSYFEYLAKGSILFQKPELMKQFRAYRDSIDQYLRQDDWFMWASMSKGAVTMPVFQSLEAFWPGVLSLIGDTDSAMRILLTYRQVMNQYGFTPEFFNIPNMDAVNKRSGYPLRPELIESTMYLYRATRDPALLQIGVELLEAIDHSSKTRCGYATVQDVKTHQIEDRMESFFLAETTKYLYLLFDVDNFIHNPGSSGDLIDTPDGKCVINSGGYVFNTEAHPIDPSILYCCSQQRAKDLQIIEDFEQNLDFLDMMGIEKDRREPQVSSDLELDETDLPKEVAELGNPPVAPQANTDPTQDNTVEYETTNGTKGTINEDEEEEEADVDEGMEGNDQDEVENSNGERDKEDEDEDEYDKSEDDSDNSSGFVVEASDPPKKSKKAADLSHARKQLLKMSIDELLEAQAGGDSEGLQLNLSQKLGDGSSEFAHTLVKAFQSLMTDFKDLVQTSNGLTAMDKLNTCNDAVEYCPKDVCRIVDQPVVGVALNRMLNAMYHTQIRLRPMEDPRMCSPSEAPKTINRYRNTVPRFAEATVGRQLDRDEVIGESASQPRLNRRIRFKRDNEGDWADDMPYQRYAEEAYFIMACPAPSFMSRLSGLGQLVMKR